MINKILLQKKLINIFFKLLPRQCIICDSESESHICSYCLPSLPFLDSYCDKCGLPLNKEKNNKENLILICVHCENDISDFNKFVTVFNYKEPIRKLIKDFKYYNNILFQKVLGDFLFDKILSKYSDNNFPEVIIPIPSYKRKLRTRGYNQSIELARYLSKKLNIPLDLNYIIKIKDTKSQVGLDREARLQNLKESFVIKKIKNYNHIVIIDDVVTTGATVLNIKNIINSNDSNVIIDVWCLAKQMI